MSSMEKEFETIDEVEQFVKPLMDEKKYVIDVIQRSDLKFVVQWQIHKTYVAQDGKVFYDEVWITKDGEMKQIQDIEPEHCRNILRMLLRQEREAEERLGEITEQLIEEIVGMTDGTSEDAPPAAVGKVLH